MDEIDDYEGIELSKEAYDKIISSKEPFNLSRASIIDYVIAKDYIRIKFRIYCYWNKFILDIDELPEFHFLTADLVVNNYTNLSYRIFGTNTYEDKVKIIIDGNRYQIKRYMDYDDHEDIDYYYCFSDCEIIDEYCKEVFSLSFKSDDVRWIPDKIYSDDSFGIFSDSQASFILGKRETSYHGGKRRDNPYVK